MGEFARSVVRRMRYSRERVFAATFAFAFGAFVWLNGPAIAEAATTLFGGVGATVRFVAAVAVTSVVYRLMRPRWSSIASAQVAGSVQRSGGAAVPAGTKHPTSVRDSLLEEFGDQHLVDVAFARAVNPGDVTEVRALISELRAGDQRTPRTTPSPALLASPFRKARHEAAHAVVALATGASVESAAVRTGIAADGREFGGIVKPVLPLANAEVQLWSRLQICLAGKVIDHRSDFRDHGSMSDVRDAEEAAQHLVSRGLRPPTYTGEMTTPALIAAATKAVEQLLDTHDRAVSRITAALLDATKDSSELRDPDLRVLFEQSDVAAAPDVVQA